MSSTRIAELRAKIRETRHIGMLASSEFGQTVPVLTDAEADAMLRQLVLEAERGLIETLRDDPNETWIETVERIEMQHRVGKSCLLDPEGGSDGT